MSKKFNQDETLQDFVYTGYEGYTNEPDWVYSDKGVIKYIDDVRTGYNFQAECKIYHDYYVIKIMS